MNCRGIDPINPFLWFSLSGLVLGIAFAILMKRVLRRKESKPVLTKFFLLLSLSILLLLPPFITGLGERLLDIRLLIALGGFFFVSLLGWTFLKVFGIPLLFIILIVSPLLALEISQWHCASPGAGLFTVEILSMEGGNLKLQIDIPGEDLKLGVASTGESPFSVHLVEASEWYFFLPSRYFFRVVERGSPPGLKLLFKDGMPGIQYKQDNLRDLLNLPLLEQEAFLLTPPDINFRPY